LISICIPTYNRLPHLKKCINSVLTSIGNYPYEFVIADGGSTDGTIEYSKSLDNVTLIEQGKLTGAIKAFNACFKKSKGDYVFFANDDFEIKPKVIIKCCNLMEKEKDIGLVAPKIQEPRFGNLPGVTVKKYGILLAKAWIYRHSVLKEINYFDEAYRTYYIDDDGFLEAMKLGYTSIFSKEIGIIHHRVGVEEVSDARAANVNKERVKKDHDHLKQKWSLLEKNVEKYLDNNKWKKTRSNIFQCICNKIWKSRSLSKMTPMSIYDHFLKKVVIFDDKKYIKLKDFYLAQRYPKEVLP